MKRLAGRRRYLGALLGTCVVAAALVGWLVGPGLAGGSDRVLEGQVPAGTLTLDGCLSNDGGTGCGDLPPAGGVGPLSVASGVAVSRDGGSVYVASTNGNSITHFFRAPAGQLSLDGCLNNDGSANCGDLPPAGAAGPLGNARSVAVSPDGSSVYVVSFTGDSVTHFFRAPAGQLTLDGCLNDDGSVGCGDLAPAGASGPLDGASGVAVSPDGSSVYVVSQDGDSITHFLRAPAGQLTLLGCWNNTGGASCADLPPAGSTGPLDGPQRVAVSPDGGSVYVSSFFNSTVTQLSRAAGGQLTLAGCLNDDGSVGCVDLPPVGGVGPLNGPQGIAVAPDGASVYVTSGLRDGVTHLQRAAGGQLSMGGCWNDDGSAGCVDLPPTFAEGPLDAASGVTVSPTGGSVVNLTATGPVTQPFDVGALVPTQIKVVGEKAFAIDAPTAAASTMRAIDLATNNAQVLFQDLPTSLAVGSSMWTTPDLYVPGAADRLYSGLTGNLIGATPPGLSISPPLSTPWFGATALKIAPFGLITFYLPTGEVLFGPAVPNLEQMMLTPNFGMLVSSPTELFYMSIGRPNVVVPIAHRGVRVFLTGAIG